MSGKGSGLTGAATGPFAYGQSAGGDVYQGLGEHLGHADAQDSLVPMQLGLGGTRSGLNEHHVPVPFFVSSRGCRPRYGQLGL